MKYLVVLLLALGFLFTSCANEVSSMDTVSSPLNSTTSNVSSSPVDSIPESGPQDSNSADESDLQGIVGNICYDKAGLEENWQLRETDENMHWYYMMGESDTQLTITYQQSEPLADSAEILDAVEQSLVIEDENTKFALISSIDSERVGVPSRLLKMSYTRNDEVFYSTTIILVRDEADVYVFRIGTLISADEYEPELERLLESAYFAS